MLNLDYIKDCIGNNLISERIFSTEFDKSREIELVDKQSAFHTDRIYIGTQKQVAGILDSNFSSDPGSLVLTSEASEPIPGNLVETHQLNVIETSLSLAACYNLLNKIMCRQRAWQSELLAMSCGPNTHTQELIEYLSKESGASVILVDPEGYVLAGCNRLSNKIPIFRSLIEEGRLSSGQLSSLKEGEVRNGFNKTVFTHYDITAFSRSISFRDSYVLILFLFEKLTESFDLKSLTYYAEEPLRISLQNVKSGDLSEEDSKFKVLWNKILDKHFNNSSEIRAEMNKFSVKPLLFSRVLVLGFEKPVALTENILLELHTIFPMSHISAEESEVVVIMHHPKRVFSLDIESDLRLKAFMEKYDAYLGYSSGSRDLDKLPSLYRLAKQILSLGRQLKLEPNERIFTHERYSVFCIIELCAQRYCSVYGNNDIILLNHPAIVHLTRYDNDHNNNLREILYVYLMNDCSISKTAAKTFMHRNTIFNKLKKIEDLVNIDFEDGATRQQLLFSCQLILYYERVMGLKLKLNGGKDE